METGQSEMNYFTVLLDPRGGVKRADNYAYGSNFHSFLSTSECHAAVCGRSRCPGTSKLHVQLAKCKHPWLGTTHLTPPRHNSSAFSLTVIEGEDLCGAGPAAAACARAGGPSS
eukprot:scaffold205877_cov16-Tisochrysis_lutea.AAC.1